MPELPEVEYLRRILARSATGRTFVAAKVNEPRLPRAVTPDFANAIANRTIERVGRRAKYLILELSGGAVRLVPLGIRGSLTHRRRGFDAGPFDRRHDHIEFTLDDGSLLVFNAPRRFGLMKLVPRGDLDSIAELKGLGPEPLGDGFAAEYFWRATRGRTVSIKNLLMDQRIVAGVGNIYASEVLFRAAVRPTPCPGQVTRKGIDLIVAATP